MAVVMVDFTAAGRLVKAVVEVALAVTAVMVERREITHQVKMDTLALVVAVVVALQVTIRALEAGQVVAVLAY
jgi:hypothetical protein